MKRNLYYRTRIGCGIPTTCVYEKQQYLRKGLLKAKVSSATMKAYTSERRIIRLALAAPTSSGQSVGVKISAKGGKPTKKKDAYRPVSQGAATLFVHYDLLVFWASPGGGTWIALGLCVSGCTYSVYIRAESMAVRA